MSVYEATSGIKIYEKTISSFYNGDRVAVIDAVEFDIRVSLRIVSHQRNLGQLTFLLFQNIKESVAKDTGHEERNSIQGDRS